VSVFDKHTATTPTESKSVKGDRHRSQILIGVTVLLVLIAYMTYVKTKNNKAAGSGGATVSPTQGQDYTSPMPTATNTPSGGAAPQTTTPFAAPTDTTGGAPIPQTSGTPTIGAPSGTVPPVTTSPSAAAAAAAPTVSAPSVATPVAYHPASAPALIAPVVTPHPTGSAALPGGTGFTPLGATIHPVSVSGTK
jgi:hypothetical protein